GRPRARESGAGASNSKKLSAGTSDASADGKGGTELPGGFWPSGEAAFTARNFRGSSPGRDFGSALEGARRGRHSGRRARLQAGFQHPKKREDPRGRNIRWDALLNQGVVRSRRGPSTGGVCFPVRE